MNDSVGEAVFTIKVNTQEAKQGLDEWRNDVNNSMSETRQSTNGLLSSFDDISRSIANLATAGLAFTGLKSAISEVTESYNSYQAAMNGVKAVAQATGNDVAASMEAIRQTTANGLISQEDAAAAIKNLQVYGYSVDQATQLINIMADAAVYNRQANYSVSEAVRVTTEGIRMENSVLSDASGITTNIAKMYERYAAQLGTTTDKLTQAQKAQAVYNGFLEEGGTFAGNAEGYTRTLAGAQQQLSTAITGVKQVLGAMFDSFAPIISGFAEWISQNQRLVATIVTVVAIIAGGAGLIAVIRLAIGVISKIKVAILAMSTTTKIATLGIVGLVSAIATIAAVAVVDTAIDSMNSSLEDTEASAGGAASSIDEMGNASSTTAKKIADLEDKLSKLNRDYQRDLKSIAVSHQQNLEKLTEQIEEANIDYQRAIDERMAKFNVSLAKEEKEHQNMVDELMTQLNFLQRYNNDYNKQKLVQVEFALAKEEALYKKQTEKEQAEIELQNAADKEKLDKKLESLQKELADEQAFMEKHRDALNSVRDIILLDEIESLNERFEEQKRSYQEQIAEARVSGVQVGNTLGSGINSALEDQLNKIDLSGQGRDIGKAIMNGIGEGLKNAANGVWEWLKQGGILKNITEWIGSLFGASKTVAKSGGDGWADGGYTGRGNPNEVAGVVHKGEYVIPADQVNQNTGLPKLGNTSIQNVTINMSGVLATSAQAKRELATELQRALEQTNQARLS